MVTIIQGNLTAAGKKFAVISARFNDLVTRRLVDGAVDTLIRHGASADHITEFKVPGAFELPAVAARIKQQQQFDAVICVGAVIRGETPHFDFVAAEVTKGIAALAISPTIPITCGVITADTMEQALDRAGGKSGNKGSEAAAAAVEMVNLYNQC